jgi:hypothetical protein
LSEHVPGFAPLQVPLVQLAAVQQTPSVHERPLHCVDAVQTWPSASSAWHVLNALQK